MKKILLAVILVVLFIPSYVFAAKFYEGEYLEGAYIKKFKIGQSTGKYEQMRMFKRRYDNMFAYCIELWESIKTDEEMIEHTSNYLEYTNIPEEKWKQVELIAYYGYGYGNHNTNSWYTATQFLIWQTISDDSIIYFTDTLNGRKTEKFTNEINEIKSLVSNHYKYPSFNNNKYQINLGEKYEIEDTNGVLKDFNIRNSSDGVKVEIVNNIFKVKATEVTTSSIYLSKGSYINPIRLYTTANGQDLIVRGDYTPLNSQIHFSVSAGKIYLKKVDSETNLSIPQGEAKLENTSYDLYDHDMKYVDNLKINSKGSASSKYLPYGIYYLKENKPGIGYKLDNKIYKINLTNSNQQYSITLKNDVIKGKIKIHKGYQPLNDNNIYPEENALFEIYNMDNLKVGEIITNTSDYGELTLPYGKYLIKQITGKDNCKYIEDFYISIEKEEDYQYNLINKEIGSKVTIYKVDSETNLPIRLSNTKFMIKDKNSNSYISYKNKEIFETNNGKLTLPFKLKLGSYELIEIEAPSGYKKLDKPYEFTITELNDEIEITISNDKIYQKIELLKTGEVISADIDKKPLSDVWYSLYAGEDIVSKDGKIHYLKNDLIAKKKTNKNGYIVFDNLIYGNYYLIETATQDMYYIDSNKYYVNITENKKYYIEKTNFLKKGNIIIKKIDNITKKAIPNVLYELYDSNNNSLMKLKTNLNGEIYIPNLVLGTYYLKEVSAPYPYIVDSDIKKIDITSNDETIRLILENKKEVEEIPNTSTDIAIPFPYYLLSIIVLSFCVLHKMLV